MTEDFIIRRIEEQAEYIARYNSRTDITRPDSDDVVESAIFIMERFQQELLKLNQGKEK